MLELRPQDPMPEWITHVAVVDGQQYKLMARKDYSPHDSQKGLAASPAQPAEIQSSPQEPLIDLKGVHIQYGKREVGNVSYEE